VELTYIVASSGTRLIGDSLEAFFPGDLCLIGPNLPHIYRNPIEPPEGAVAEVLQFRRDMAGGFLDACPELKAFSDLLDRSDRGLHFDVDTAGAVYPRLQELRRAEGVSRWRSLIELIEELVAAPEPELLTSEGYTGASDPGYPDQMYRVCQYIMEHFDEEIRHEEMAAMAGLSPAHFSRVFKKTARIPFRRFLLNVRLGHAARLLEETDWKIADICFRCGFQNLSNFNRQFQAYYSLSPRAYRQARIRTWFSIDTDPGRQSTRGKPSFTDERP